MFINRLKRFMLVPAVMLGMAACQSGADEPDGGGHGDAMTFTTEVTSRTSVVSNSSLKQSPIVLFGDMKFGTKLVVFNGTYLTFDDDSQKWMYTGTQYWFPKHEHSFAAYHPADASGLSDVRYSDSKLFFTYTYPIDNYKNTTDLLIATHRRLYVEEGIADPVRLKFSHILSNISVDVKVKAPPVEVQSLTVNKIIFKNIPSKASYEVTAADLTAGSSSTYDYANDDATFYGWTVEERADLVMQFPASGENSRIIPNDQKSHSLFTGSDALLLLPNPDSNTEMLISYTTTDATGSLVYDKTDKVTIPNDWKPGLSYLLALTIINGKTQFSIEVADWKQGDDTENTVPRKEKI